MSNLKEIRLNNKHNQLIFILFMFLAVFLSIRPAQSQAESDLWVFVQNDRSDRVQQLLDKGLDPNTRSGIGNPIIMQAVRDGAWTVFDLLLKHPGTDINILNGYQETPLMYVSLVGDLNRAKALVARGATINQLGWTPLHYAAAKGQLPVIEFLLQQGALPNSPAPNGESPIMMAASAGAIDSVQLLIKAGADPTAIDMNGNDAITIARDKGHTQLAQALEKIVRERSQREQKESQTNPK
jgi:ankyrin repeat protein